MGNITVNIPEKIYLDVHSHGGSDMISGLSAKIDSLTTLVKSVIEKEVVMSAQLDTLTTQVKANTDAEASAVLLIQGLSAQIAAIKTDPVALQALSDSLKASADSLGAAVVANTPAA